MAWRECYHGGLSGRCGEDLGCTTGALPLYTVVALAEVVYRYRLIYRLIAAVIHGKRTLTATEQLGDNP